MILRNDCNNRKHQDVRDINRCAIFF